METAAKRGWVIEQARKLGFDLCGIAPAEKFPELAHLPEWLERGYGGEMRYLHDARRASPELALPGARSVIVCALNYNTPLPYSTDAHRWRKEGRGWISRYAWGDDYHEIVKEKLDALVAAMRSEFAEPFEARAYVDTGPIVERVAAKYAGLGWLGKNTCLINEHLGSWLFLGTIITTLELTPSLEPENGNWKRENGKEMSLATSHSFTPSGAEGPLAASQNESPVTSHQSRPFATAPDLCGNCTMCIDACPTGAIVEPYVLDARRCISYLTIELRGPIPQEFYGALAGNVFGCDICQDVCPYNRRAPVSSEPRFLPRQVVMENGNWKMGQGHGQVAGVAPLDAGHAPLANSENQSPVTSHESLSLFAPPLEWLASLSEEEFREIFRGSAVKRTKWRGLVRNACIALSNVGLRPGDALHALAVSLLENLAVSSDLIISSHARWALDRLRQPYEPRRRLGFS